VALSATATSQDAGLAVTGSTSSDGENGLQVALGHASRAGSKGRSEVGRNEDFCGAVTPDGLVLATKGLLAAVADGLGGHDDSHEASEYAVRGLLADYYATPDTWSVPHALERVLAALNGWLYGHALRQREIVGKATTLSALVLRGTRYFTAHVGDSRIYLLRAGVLHRLTTDHVWDHPELDNVLKRALGLDAQLTVDQGDGALQRDDRFALLTDGVWSYIDEAQVTQILQRSDPGESAAMLVQAASDRNSPDDATALVVHVLAVPSATLRDLLAVDTRLPLPPRLRVGDRLDGLLVDAVLHESRVTLLYRVRNAAGEPLVLKTLRQDAGDEACAALVHEDWLARRVTSHYFPQALRYEARTHLYYLMTWHEGASLGKRLAAGQHFTVAAVVQLGIRLLKGAAALHRLSIVHRDIKPDNIHQGADGRLRILDLGVAASDGLDFAEINNPGTPSYMAPELLDGEPATVVSDLYGCGVSLYQLLTRRYPYGEVEPFQHPRFGDPISPVRYRPDVPDWLEAVLLKSFARDPKQRFETAEEFLLALERGAARPLAAPRRTPLAQRVPGIGLRLLAAVSLLANLLLLLLLLARKAS
jgi:serine/threonine protein phosphatase PrpC